MAGLPMRNRQSVARFVHEVQMARIAQIAPGAPSFFPSLTSCLAAFRPAQRSFLQGGGIGKLTVDHQIIVHLGVDL